MEDRKLTREEIKAAVLRNVREMTIEENIGQNVKVVLKIYFEDSQQFVYNSVEYGKIITRDLLSAGAIQTMMNGDKISGNLYKWESVSDTGVVRVFTVDINQYMKGTPGRVYKTTLLGDNCIVGKITFRKEDIWGK